MRVICLFLVCVCVTTGGVSSGAGPLDRLYNLWDSVSYGSLVATSTHDLYRLYHVMYKEEQWRVSHSILSTMRLSGEQVDPCQCIVSLLPCLQ